MCEFELGVYIYMCMLCCYVDDICVIHESDEIMKVEIMSFMKVGNL